MNEELLEAGLGRISAFLDKGVAKRKLTQAEAGCDLGVHQRHDRTGRSGRLRPGDRGHL